MNDIVRPITSVEKVTPSMSPICWYEGVAPRRKPVLRSCEVAPALAAAMHTMPPTQRAIGWYMSSVHPSARKSRQVAISVAMVMPETGFELVPIRPTIREATVTKKNPNTTIRTPSRRRPAKLPGRKGSTAMIPTSARLPSAVTPRGRSCSVRFALAAPASPRSEARLPLKLDTIVGSVLSKVMNPPAATAPAPICRTYA